MQNTPPPLSKNALWLGYAGLLPQLIAVLLLLDGAEMRWIATAGGYGYAALIFSFLGGLWWAIGMLSPSAPKWIFAAAIAPSLIALATFLPWTWGWSWPGPSLAALAAGCCYRRLSIAKWPYVWRCRAAGCSCAGIYRSVWDC